MKEIFNVGENNHLDNDRETVVYIKNMERKNKLAKRKKRDFAPGELREIVLKVLGISILVGGTVLITPNFPIIYTSILKLIEEVSGKEIPEKKIRRVIKNLEKRKIIYIQEKGDQAIVQITDENNTSILTYSLKALFDFKKKSKKWNGKWFMVFFDVPEIQRSKRDYLRNYLIKLGFFAYQKSVYIFPYECEKEVELIKKLVEGAKFMKYVIAERIEDESRIKEYFKI